MKPFGCTRITRNMLKQLMEVLQEQSKCWYRMQEFHRTFTGFSSFFVGKTQEQKQKIPDSKGAEN